MSINDENATFWVLDKEYQNSKILDPDFEDF
jgi:hypothetical protein